MRPAGDRRTRGTRPAALVLVAGTGTEVGKTWISARLVEQWRRSGLAAAARKPAQSYEVGEKPTDAEVLAAATGEDPLVVCPPAHSYPVALAPPMAASVLGLPVPSIADLLGGLAWPDGPVDVGLVETAGGVRSPQADDGDVIDLASALGPDHIVLVADAGLGTINAVRLSTAALAAPGLPSTTVVLNRFDQSSELHRRNLEWLRDVDGLCVVAAASPGIESVARSLSLAQRRQ
ncbi:MAG TPA: dethiobiotin synthase [Acidimicrobiales bacterium]|nr:dethiobiotin synthase [Acidimicrobiales bacterium]